MVWAHHPPTFRFVAVSVLQTRTIQLENFGANTVSEDPRLGLPSASSFGLDAICPGRQALLATVGDIPEPFDEDANRGTVLHACWERGAAVGLSGEDEELFNEGERLVKEAFSQWAMKLSALPKAIEGPREHRFWLHDQDGNVAASGQADRHWYCGVHGLIIDYKSLWAKSLAPSELNWQLLFLAVCAAREYDLQHVRCAFVKPMYRQLDIVDYNEQDLERAQSAVQQVLWNSKHILDRRAGPHCRHCKAVTVCQEAMAYCLLPSVTSKSLRGVTAKTAVAIAESLDLKDCVKIWQTQTSRRNIEDAIKARLKDLPEPELEALGLKLGEARINRVFSDPRQAVVFMLQSGIADEAIWSAIDIGSGKLDKVVQKSLGLSSGKAATDWIREKLQPFITEKPQEPPLEEI